MFRLSGYLDRKNFFWAFALRFGLFLVSVVGYPTLWIDAMPVFGCGARPGIGLDCSFISYTFAIWFKPLALSLFVFSCIGITLRRARDTGAPTWVGLMVPLLFAAEHDFFDYFWFPWSQLNSQSFKIMFPPSFALLGLACVAVLCALPSRSDNLDSPSPFGLVGLIALGLGLPIAFLALLRALYGFSVAQPLVRPIASLLSPVLQLIPYIMNMLSVVLVCVTWQAFRSAGSRNQPQTL
jgi:uncharacterized membrane protein YhaH (DUF805 family)